MFRAAMCPSSGELLCQCDTWFMSLCGMQEHMILHTRRSSTQSDINQESHWYNNSPDDGHMAARNIYRIGINIYENCLSSRLFTRIIPGCTINKAWNSKKKPQNRLPRGLGYMLWKTVSITFDWSTTGMNNRIKTLHTTCVTSGRICISLYCM